MSSKPCYTCEQSFVTSKQQYLINKKIDDAKEFAQKNNYRGTMAIVAVSGTDSFAIRKEDEGFAGWDVHQYLYFD